MAWFRVVKDRICYRGHLAPEPFAVWATGSKGSTTIAQVAHQYRFRLFTTSRARRRLWHELKRAARAEPLSTAIRAEADHFAAVTAEASYAPGLPRVSVALHRLVIVPRVLVAGGAQPALRRRLWAIDALATVNEHVREFFCEQMLVELDAAIAERRPSAKRPVLMRDGWGCIGRDAAYQWVDPMFCGPDWLGHFLMFEFPREGMSRRTRKDLEHAVNVLQNGLAKLSRAQRHEIVRGAVDSLRRLTA
jgi:hypothetical protein